MTEFNRAMVALDMSPMDKSLIQYSHYITRILQTKTAYFLNIIPDMSKPKNMAVEFHKLFSPHYPVDEKVRDKPMIDAQEVFEGRDDIKLQVDVIEGKPFQQLLHWAEIKAIDLLIVGKKKKSEGSGITAKKVAMKCKCSVLFMPEECNPDIRNIIVPMDFSAYSLRALQTALKFKKQLPSAKIKVVHVMIPQAAPHFIYQSEKLPSLVEENAQTAWQNFLEKHQIKANHLDFHLLESRPNQMPEQLREYAADTEADLILMGAKGHSTLEKFLYGSVTEQVVAYEKHSAVLVVR